MEDDCGVAARGAKKPVQFTRSLTYSHHRPSASAGKQWRQRHHHGGSRARLVLYTTSLRGVRRTFTDCCTVRAILRGFRVAVDERDVSMDAAFRRELQALLAARGRAFALPQLFIGGHLVGGADEVRQLNENGQLRRLLDGAAGQDPAFVCDACGGVRFVPCAGCGGGRKVFVEEEDRVLRCGQCNENGLVRCASCCS